MEKLLKKKIIKEINQKLSLKDKIVSKIFKKHTYKIFKIGIEAGFNWENK